MASSLPSWWPEFEREMCKIPKVKHVTGDLYINSEGAREFAFCLSFTHGTNPGDYELCQNILAVEDRFSMEHPKVSFKKLTK